MSKTKKIIIWVVGVAVVGYAVLYGVGYGLMKYDQYKMSKIPENFAKFEEEQRQLAMADTYGGKTPEETLDMFIKAVQAGDYDLASKHFVIPRQGEWKERLEKYNKDDLSWFLEKMLMVATLDSKTDTRASMSSKVKDSNAQYSDIGFWKYPNDIWKINDLTPTSF